MRNRLLTSGVSRVFGQGSPFNIPAGHHANIDKVVEHYRQKHLQEEERKLTKLLAKQQE